MKQHLVQGMEVGVLYDLMSPRQAHKGNYLALDNNREVCKFSPLF